MGREQREELWLGEVKAKGLERYFELVVVDPLVFVEVEEAELLVLAVAVTSCGDFGPGVPFVGGTYCFVYLVSLLVSQLGHAIACAGGCAGSGALAVLTLTLQAGGFASCMSV